MRVKLNELKQDSRERFFMLCADMAFDLPSLTPGVMIDLSSSNSEWIGALNVEEAQGAVQVGENEYEFDVSRFTLPGTGTTGWYGGICKNCSAGTTYEALTLVRIVHVKRNYQPYGYIDVPIYLIP